MKTKILYIYYATTILMVAPLCSAHMLPQCMEPKNSISNAVNVILKPLVHEVGGLRIAERAKQSPELKMRLINKIDELTNALERCLGPSASNNNPHALFYYGQGLYHTAPRYSEGIMDADFKSRSKVIDCFTRAADMRHPGAAEMLAQLSTNRQDEIKWRFKAMKYGCITSFRRFYKEIDFTTDEYEYKELPDTVYTFAFMQMLVEAKVLQQVDILHSIMMQHAAFLRDAIKNKFGVKYVSVIMRCEYSAVNMFNDISDTYLKTEIMPETW